MKITIDIDNTLFGQLVTAVCRRNGYVNNQLIVQMPDAWTPTILDPEKGEIDNPISQLDYVKSWLMHNVFGQIIDQDIVATGDVAKLAMIAKAEAENEVIRLASVEAALTAKDLLVPSVKIQVE